MRSKSDPKISTGILENENGPGTIGSGPRKRRRSARLVNEMVRLRHEIRSFRPFKTSSIGIRYCTLLTHNAGQCVGLHTTIIILLTKLRQTIFTLLMVPISKRYITLSVGFNVEI